MTIKTKREDKLKRKEAGSVINAMFVKMLKLAIY